MSRVQLRWSEAEVHDGRLRVPLDPKPEKQWTKRFQGTVALLDRGSFGEVELKKGEVRVGPVQPGSEEKLRHFLESVVLEANGPEPAEHPDGEEEQQQDAERGGESEAADADREMTERFRGFDAASGAPASERPAAGSGAARSERPESASEPE
jgi:hypothetical protein